MFHAEELPLRGDLCLYRHAKMDRGTVLLLACLNVVAIAALFQRFGPGIEHDFGGVGIKVAEWFNSIGDSVASGIPPEKTVALNAQISAKRMLPTCGTLTNPANSNFIIFSQRVVLPGGVVGPAAGEFHYTCSCHSPLSWWQPGRSHTDGHATVQWSGSTRNKQPSISNLHRTSCSPGLPSSLCCNQKVCLQLLHSNQPHVF